MKLKPIFFLMCCGVITSTAFAETIKVKPILPAPPVDNDKRPPHAPARSIISCELDFGQLIVTSEQSCTAFIEIVDSFGSIVLTDSRLLSPSASLDLSFLESDNYTLYIIVDDITYQGEFSI